MSFTNNHAKEKAAFHQEAEKKVAEFLIGLSPAHQLEYHFAVHRVKRAVRHRKNLLRILLGGGVCAAIIQLLNIVHSTFLPIFQLPTSPSPFSGWVVRIILITILTLIIYRICSSIWYEKEDKSYRTEFDRLRQE